MKKTFLIIVAAALLLQGSLAFAYELPDLDAMELDELLELQVAVEEAIQAKKMQSFEDGEYAEATRSNPALIAQPAIVEGDNYSVKYKSVFTVQHVLLGDAAGVVASSFNKYNARTLEKGTEWILVHIYIEAMESDSEKIDFNSYNFRFVNSKGVEVDTEYLADNPSEVSPLYVGSSQLAWLATKVIPGENYFLTFSEYDNDTIWFDLNHRAIVDTSSITFEPIDKQSADKSTIIDLQLRLLELGYLKSAPTGKYDSSTSAAVKKVQKALNLKQTGVADSEVLKVIMSGASIP